MADLENNAGSSPQEDLTFAPEETENTETAEDTRENTTAEEDAHETEDD